MCISVAKHLLSRFKAWISSPVKVGTRAYANKKYIAPNEILTLLLQCPVTNDVFALHRGPVLVPQYCLQKAVAS